MNPSPMWYASRGTGYVSLLLLTASVALGVTTSIRFTRPGWPRFISQSVHRSVALLVMVFLAIHIVTAIVDPFAGLGARDAVVPWGSSYRPVWMGLGVVGFELLIALIVTSLLRRWMNFRVWRAVHWLAYLSWPVAMVHGLGTGTDTKALWGAGLDIACAGVVVAAIGVRAAVAFNRFPTRSVGAVFAAVMVAALITAWTVQGPLAPGWARASGTPDVLLASSGGSAAPASASPSPSAQPGGGSTAPSATPAGGIAGLDDSVSGTLSQDDGDTRAVLVDQRDGALQIVVTAGQDGSASFTLTRGGAVECSTTPQVGDAVTGTCNGIPFTLTLQSAGRRSVSGRFQTRAAAS